MRPTKRKKIVIGIDDRLPSKIAASILRNQDYDLVGVHLRIDLKDEQSLYPSAMHRSNLAEVEKVCAALGMPLKTIDVTEETLAKVFDPYWYSTLQGRIDHPELRWLRDVLLPHLLDIARQFGADEVATGHFARRPDHILRYTDLAFDQSLPFSGLSREVISRLVLPMGDVSPDRVVRLARGLEAIPADENDKTGEAGIEALRKDRADRGRWRWERSILADPKVQARAVGDFFKPGSIRGTEEFSLGEHDGVPFYPLGSVAPNDPEQIVVDILPQSRTLIIGSEAQLRASSALLRDVRWVEPQTNPYRSKKVWVRSLREGAEETTATLTPYPGGIAEIRFNPAMTRLTPHEILVFLEESRVLGSGEALEVTRGSVLQKAIETPAESE